MLYAYDRVRKNGEDLYGVEFVLKNFSQLPKEYSLVFIDLNHQYEQDIQGLPKDRIIYFSGAVNFKMFLSNADVYIRPTCSDGYSIAIQEALVLGTPVLASDVVNRPESVITYHYGDFDDFLQQLLLVNKLKSKVSCSLESILNLLRFWEEI